MTKRLFIAINLPEELKNKLAEIQTELKMRYKNYNINWVNPKIMHLTLVFLGDIDEDNEYNIKNTLQNVISEFNQTEIITRNFSAFPNEFVPKVLFLKTHNTDSKLFQLHKKIIDSLLNKGIEPDLKKLKLHITIARIKEKVEIDFNNIKLQEFAFKVDNIYLMESQLTSEAPIYNIVKQYKLK